MKLGPSTFTSLIGAALVALALGALPDTADAQRYESDHEFERKTLSANDGVIHPAQGFLPEPDSGDNRGDGG